MDGFGYAILAYLAINGFLYMVIILCIIFSKKIFVKRRNISITLLLIAIAPLMHYVYFSSYAYDESVRRPIEIASWHKNNKLLVPVNSIAVMGNDYSYIRELALLAATGIVNDVQYYRNNKWYGGQLNETNVYTVKEDPICLDPTSSSDNYYSASSVSNELILAALARHGFFRCVSSAKRKGSPNSPLQLFQGSKAPNRYYGAACLRNSDDPLELRWSPENGGELFAFGESELNGVYVFPPLLSYHSGRQGIFWQCVGIFDHHNYSKIDYIDFVASSLGYKTPNSFPKSADPYVAVEALKILKTKLKYRYAHNYVISLLGQWPSTPKIAETLNDKHFYENNSHIVYEVSKILTDPSENERKNTFYPFLDTHLKSLLDICEHSSKFIHDPCDKLSKINTQTTISEPVTRKAN